MSGAGRGPTGVVDRAYQHCEVITRTEARNFSYGIRLLPAPKRRALSAVYAFARRIDDIGDGDLPAREKLARLGAARQALRTRENQVGDQPEGQPAGQPEDLVLVALADAVRRFPIPVGAFEELIDGCEADVRGTAYATFEELLHYCRCVAGSVGRLSLGVFGTEDMAVASPRADALGVALQLTNILRDVREDYLAGRTYLPAEDLERFGARLELADGEDAFRDPAGRLVELVRFEVERAQQWYQDGFAVLPLLDRRSAACTAAMAGIYRRLLDRIAADPPTALRMRTALTAREKLFVAVRSLAGLSASGGSR